MAKHLAIGQNFIKGTIEFNDEKQKVVSFGKTFIIKPQILLTGESDDEDQKKPLFTKQITTTGCIVRCKEKYTGIVNYIITGD